MPAHPRHLWRERTARTRRRSLAGNSSTARLIRIPGRCAARDELELLVPRRVRALLAADNGYRPAGQRSACANPIPLQRLHGVGPRGQARGHGTAALSIAPTDLRELRGPDADARLVGRALSDPFATVHRHPERKAPIRRERKS